MEHRIVRGVGLEKRGCDKLGERLGGLFGDPFGWKGEGCVCEVRAGCAPFPPSKCLLLLLLLLLLRTRPTWQTRHSVQVRWCVTGNCHTLPACAYLLQIIRTYSILSPLRTPYQSNYFSTQLEGSTSFFLPLFQTLLHNIHSFLSPSLLLLLLSTVLLQVFLNNPLHPCSVDIRDQPNYNYNRLQATLRSKSHHQQGTSLS